MTVVFAADSFADFDGGTLASLDDPAIDAGLPLTSRVLDDDLVSGALTPAAAVSPEPPGFLLFGSGMLGLAQLARTFGRRHREV